MRYEYSDDLFEDSKMSFGQHLEELRLALFKSIVALVIGFLIGLVIGQDLVRRIQKPLVEGMAKYYRDIGEDGYANLIDELQEDERSLQYTLGQIESLLKEEQLTSKLIYVSPDQFIEGLQRAFPGQFDDIELQIRSGLDVRENDDLEDSSGEDADDGGAGEGTSQSESGTEGEGGDGETPPAAPTLERDRLIPLMVFERAAQDTVLGPSSFSVQEPFVVYIKASLVAGAILASPAIFYFIWQFVASGLYPHERRYVYIYLPFSIGLFFAGAALAFFVVIRFVLNFLFMFNASMGIDPVPRISDWLSFVLILPLGFGISFQLPLVMLFLERIGLASVPVYLEKWRMAVLVICIISMLLTPSDPQSMILMAVPLIFLYFGGVLLCKYMPRASASPFADAID